MFYFSISDHIALKNWMENVAQQRTEVKTNDNLFNLSGVKGDEFDNVIHAKRAAKSAINLYNQIRLHVSLDYKTPNMVYKLTA